MSTERGAVQGARKLALVVRLFVLTAGQAAAWRTLPLYLAVGIIALVLFGGNGMDAETVTREAELDLGFRMALLTSWALSTLPTARVWLGTPETFFVRALPVSRHTVVSVLGVGCYAPDGLEALPDLRASEYLSLVRGLRSLPRRSRVRRRYCSSMSHRAGSTRAE